MGQHQTHTRLDPKQPIPETKHPTLRPKPCHSRPTSPPLQDQRPSRDPIHPPETTATLTSQAGSPQAVLEGALLLLIGPAQPAGVFCQGTTKLSDGTNPIVVTPPGSPLPLGSPSCCSSLERDSLSTPCLAALERMKPRTAMVAFTSPDSAWGRCSSAAPATSLPIPRDGAAVGAREAALT